MRAAETLASAAPVRASATPARAMRPTEALSAALRVVCAGRSANDAFTAYERLLAQCLEVVGWSGETRHLVDALPHVDPLDDLETCRQVLKRLGLSTEPARLRADAVDAATPFLMAYDGAPRLVFARDRDGCLLAAPTTANGPPERLGRPKGEIDVLRLATVATPSPARSGAVSASWFMSRVSSASGQIGGALTLTLLANLFAVATPLYAILVYNTAIPAKAYDTLAFGLAIILGALAAETVLRRQRERVVARFAAGLHGVMLREGVRKVLALPITMIEAVSTGAQLAQLRRMENVMGLFQGSVATALLDAPFALLFVIAIAMISPSLAVIPLLLIILFAVFALIFAPLVRHAESRTADARREAQEMLRETVVKARAIQATGLERSWLARVDAALRADAAAAARREVAHQIATHVGQAALAVGAAAMLAFGALLAIDGALSIGALIAATMLMWRALAPIQTICLSLAQLRAVGEDAGMVDQLMKMPEEASAGAAARIHRRFEGRLRFDAVAHRQPRTNALSLRGVGFEVGPGERVGVVDVDALGPSMVLRLALGLETPTAGAVSLDGLPLTQLDLDEMRSAFAFAPARPHFFYGTVAQNMRLARPELEDREIEAMLEALEQPLYPEAFPQGLQTRLTGAARARLGPAALQRLSLARALLSARPVLLLEAPMAELDPASQAAALAQLDRQRDRCAALVTGVNRPLLESCDQVLVLSRGRMAAYGRASEILAALDKSEKS